TRLVVSLRSGAEPLVAYINLCRNRIVGDADESRSSLDHRNSGVGFVLRLPWALRGVGALSIPMAVYARRPWAAMENRGRSFARSFSRETSSRTVGKRYTADSTETMGDEFAERSSFPRSHCPSERDSDLEPRKPNEPTKELRRSEMAQITTSSE